MLLDELLIKVGIEADSQAMQEFEQFLDTVGSGTESAVEGLGSQWLHLVQRSTVQR